MQMKIIPSLFRNSLLLITVLYVLMNQQIKAQVRSIDQIQFSKDSSTIIGFSINDKTFNLAHSIPVLQWAASLNQQSRIQYKILQTNKIDDGIDLLIQFKNNSKDTLSIDNVIPFEKNDSNVYITGKGDHSLSRTHLFIPGKTPVNVIVPDNAWELGYNSLSLDKALYIYGFSRRDKQSIQLGKTKRFETNFGAFAP
mgnify:FL=1